MGSLSLKEEVSVHLDGLDFKSDVRDGLVLNKNIRDGLVINRVT